MTDFLSIQPAAAQSHVKDGTGSRYDDMNWISDTQIEAIKRQVSAQSFPEKRTHIPQWYTRFFSLGVGVACLVIWILDRQPRWTFWTLFMMFSAYTQHIEWQRFREQYVLKLELEKNRNVEAPSAGKTSTLVANFGRQRNDVPQEKHIGD